MASKIENEPEILDKIASAGLLGLNKLIETIHLRIPKDKIPVDFPKEPFQKDSPLVFQDFIEADTSPMLTMLGEIQAKKDFCEYLMNTLEESENKLNKGNIIKKGHLILQFKDTQIKQQVINSLKKYVAPTNLDLLIQIINGQKTDKKIQFNRVASKIIDFFTVLHSDNLLESSKETTKYWLIQNCLSTSKKQAKDFQIENIKKYLYKTNEIAPFYKIKLSKTKE